MCACGGDSSRGKSAPCAIHSHTKAILLAQDIENVPFDLRHQRVIVYANTSEGLEALRTQLMTAIQTALASSSR